MDYVSTVSEILEQMPTMASGRAALAILRELAQDGDIAALRALGVILARRIGFDHAIPVIEGLDSSTSVLQTEPIPPLLRLYLAAFVPRELMSQANAAVQAAAGLYDEQNYLLFQRLVYRNDLVQDEVLKGYCLAAFAGSMGMLASVGSARAAGGWQHILDGILAGCRVIPGDSANTRFEIGRERILNSTAGWFAFVLNHEMGHHISDLMWGSAGQTASNGESTASFADEVLAIANALPVAMRKALSEPAVPPNPVRPGQQISLLVSVCAAPRGAYMHWSLTMMGAPIPLRTGMIWAAILLRLFGIHTADAAVAYSPRGVFHFGFRRTVDPDTIAWPHDATDAMQQVNAAEAAADVWLEQITNARKLGTNETSIAVELGLLEPAARIFPAGSTALRDIQICQSLASQSHSIDLSEEDARELMGAAMRCAYLPIIEALLDAGVRPEHHLGELGSSIGVAMLPAQADKSFFGPTAANTNAAFRWLHEKGVDLDHSIDAQGTTLLLDAVRQGSASVSTLLALGANPNRADAQGQTALALAVAHDDNHAVDTLLQHGADPDTPDATGATPLMSASSGNVVRELVDAGARPNTADHAGRTPLIAAAERGHVEVVRALLEAGADPEGADDMGVTALHFVAGQIGESAQACLAALLKAGSEADDETRDGTTPLMIAARAGSLDAVRLLMQSGANVNACDENGDTPLILACKPFPLLSRNLEHSSEIDAIVRALVEGGADLDAQNDEGLSVLHVAAQIADSSSARMLLHLGARVDPWSRDGKTPLMYATARGHTDVMAALIDAGANVNARDGQGVTPLMIAASMANPDSPTSPASILKRRNADGADI